MTINALSYDYTSTIEASFLIFSCLAQPHKPQYGGGIIINPKFDHGLEGWTVFGGAKIESRKSHDGNSFIVAHSRNKSYDCFSQKLHLEKGKLYTLSAWIQVSKGSVLVTVSFKTKSGFMNAGGVLAESGCWTMLKGGLTVDTSGPAEIYFESKNTDVEIWVDSVSLQSFTEEQWRVDQDKTIEQARKRNVKLHAVDSQGKSLVGAKVFIKQNRPGFPFGAAMDKTILNNPTYQKWFVSRFKVTTFENEMKWYSTEQNPGREDYSTADAMLKFAKGYGISVRGHNILWDDPNYQPSWIKSLSPDQLRAASEKRINSVVSKYAGQVIAWDVMNEDLHFSYFEDKLGSDFSRVVFQKVHQLDSKTLMFLNDFNTVEDSRDGKTVPGMYLKKLREILGFFGNSVPIGIGLEGHYSTPNIPYMRAAIDTLAAARMPIWLTEVDVSSNQNQVSSLANFVTSGALYLEQILREAYAHPAVHGIILWTARRPEGCYRMCLTDNSFRNLPTGDVVDKLLREWRQMSLEDTTDENGFFEASLVHGDYDVTISHPSMNSSTKSFATTTGTSQETTLHFQIKA
ncbi:hypothetical protein GIB67_010795 [Kingdonia uniflora]|uniref:GH10 domain-containing protein n=1 Tax=Kingdonia uniflora TaxID=39325 RepID=A0A7J7L921_9MAGN|nr:hypothetical protein GIB67_010795 [Kingdonia uniflora]